MTVVLIFAILGLSIFLFLWWKRKSRKKKTPKPDALYKEALAGSKTIEIRKSILTEDLPKVIVKDDENKSE